jgi:uncharacterized membrane protein
LSDLLVVAAAAFFLLHVLPSTPVRARSVALAGEGVYLAVFSLLSLVTIWWLTKQFNAAPYGTKLWFAPSWWPWLQAALILFALILSVGGLTTPNPSSPGAGKLLESPHAAGGIFAITRHPVMWGAGIWALAHMVSVATPRGLWFFGAFAATALVGIWLQQKRKRATLPGWTAFEAKTSFFPFAAILDGRAKLSLKAIGWWRAAIALALWAAVLHYHFWLFGARPLPLAT